MSPILKFIIAVLLVLCLFDMPYGFYTLVRFAAMAAFVYLSYEYFKQKRDGMGFLFAALAVLLQPFAKIAIGRTLWNIIDILIALLLFYVIIKGFKRKK